MKNEILDNLKLKLAQKGEMDADKHDGSYELVRETIKILSKYPINKLGSNDLNMLYFMTIGTWKRTIDGKKGNIDESSLKGEDKEYLYGVLDKIWKKATEYYYENSNTETIGSFGMFGTGVGKLKSNDEDSRNFLNMCIQLSKTENEDEMFSIVKKTLQKPMKGVGIATLSQILHCIKPYNFPVFNNATQELGLSGDITEYVENVKKIKKFRDENFKFKNYRLIDIGLWDIAESDSNDLGILPQSSTPMNTSKPIKDLNTILYGAPGTGKTYNTINYALSIIQNKTLDEINKEDRTSLKKRFDDYKEQGQIVFCTFHQSLSYEEFIEGIKARSNNGTISYPIEPGIFKSICKNALNEGGKNYVLIIDEINRGNMSKIFGELITLLEPSKRIGAEEVLKVKLPYSQDEFGVPQNLYVIGTMNTTDRSIALIDIALRRRFTFIEIEPNSSLLNFKVGNINIQEMFETINERIEFLYDRDHRLGHSFFMPLKDNNGQDNNSLTKLNEIFHNNIIPLLQEYFYEDWEKIQIVLGDHKNQRTKNKEDKLIQEDIQSENIIIGFNHEDTEDKAKYTVNKKPTEKSYLGIYSKTIDEKTE